MIRKCQTMPPLAGLENHLGRGNYIHAAPLELYPSSAYVKEHALPAPIQRAGSSSFEHFTMGAGKVIVSHYRYFLKWFLVVSGWKSGG
jgi:hypothetical protein